MEIMRDFVLTIDGASSYQGGSFPVDDPATGEPFADAPDATEAELEAAVAAAERAYATWRVDDAARRSAMLKAAETLEVHAAELGPLLTREQGKPLSDAIGEVQIAATWLRYYADLELSADVVRDDEFDIDSL